ncbi:MAG: hypothetical protein PHU85_02200 [Phycisphaerae bacterium]|nr:hypothetical protein [Phycisphaerae bacterium]
MRPSRPDRTATGIATATVVLLTIAAWGADVPEELRIKPEQVFEFAAKPSITRDGDRITIRFASKGFCDVTVAIEDAGGRIVRHLASGVPAPPSPRSIGGDEVSLMQPSYLATMTDRYLYIGDVGNGRVVQVKLDYRAEERAPLKGAKAARD